jgi:hypothetical protein
MNMKTLVAVAALAATLTPSPARADVQDTYPLTTCVVSGEKLGDHGEPYLMRFQDREVRFCCKKCRKDFLKDPAKYLKILDDAHAKAASANARTEKPQTDHHAQHHHD